LRELSIKQHHKQHGEPAGLKANAHSSLTAEVPQTESLTYVVNPASKREKFAAQVRELSTTLRLYVVPTSTLQEGIECASSSFLSEEVCSFQFRPESLIVVHIGAHELSLGSIWRNNLACLLSAVHVLTATVSAYASSHFCVPTAGGELTWAAPFSLAEPLDLEITLTNLTALYHAIMAGLAASLQHQSASLSETARAELCGKVAADLAKFLTSMVSHVLYLDLACASMRTPGAASALRALTACSTSTALQIQQDENSLPSDLLQFALNSQLLSLDILCRTLTLAARVKTAAYYENCKGLIGMNLCMNQAMLHAIGRLLIQQRGVLRGDLNTLCDENIAWYKDSATRLLIRSTLGESWSNLVSILSENL
jgi:hypothetical protein